MVCVLYRLDSRLIDQSVAADRLIQEASPGINLRSPEPHGLLDEAAIRNEAGSFVASYVQTLPDRAVAPSAIGPGAPRRGSRARY